MSQRFGFSSIVTSETSSLGKAFSGWSHEFAQMGCGNFIGAMSELWLGKVQVFSDSTNLAVDYIGHCWPNSQVFVTYFAGPAVISYGNRRCESDKLITNRWDVVDRSSTSDRFMNVGLAVDRDFLEDYARQCFQVPNPLPLFDHGTARMDTSAVRMLQRRILNVLRTFGDSPELVEDPVICVSLIEHLLYPIIDNFIDHGECDRWAPPSTRDYIVSRGREIIEAGLGQPIRMADMCRELRISQRTLEYSFQDVLGVSPASYSICADSTPYVAISSPMAMPAMSKAAPFAGASRISAGSHRAIGRHLARCRPIRAIVRRHPLGEASPRESRRSNDPDRHIGAVELVAVLEQGDRVHHLAVNLDPAHIILAGRPA